MGARGSWAHQLFPQGLLTARQSLPQVSHPIQLEHWGGVEETEASPPALPPSLPPSHPGADPQRGTETHIPAWPHLLPSPSWSLSHPEPHGLSLPRTLCSSLPFPGAWAGGFPSTSTPSGGCLPGGGKWRRQGCRAALGAGWPTDLLLLLLCSPIDDPPGDPYLPSPTAFLGLPCFSTPSARKCQALCMSLLAGQGVGH